MKLPGAETLLRAVIDNDEGVRGAVLRERWLAGQAPEYLTELADACEVLAVITRRAMTERQKPASSRDAGRP